MFALDSRFRGNDKLGENCIQFLDSAVPLHQKYGSLRVPLSLRERRSSTKFFFLPLAGRWISRSSRGMTENFVFSRKPRWLASLSFVVHFVIQRVLGFGCGHAAL
jgi:hypothetical protein